MIWAKHPDGEIREYADLDEAAMAFRDNAEEPVEAVKLTVPGAIACALTLLELHMENLRREDAEAARHEADERRMLR